MSFTVPRRLRATAPTAYARTEDRVDAHRAGFTMHRAKPFDPTERVVVLAARMEPCGKSTP